MSHPDDPPDYAKRAGVDLVAAYRARLAWLENEKQRSKSKVLREELGRVEGALGAASHAIYDLMQVHTRLVERNLDEMRRGMADRDAIVQPLLRDSDLPKTDTEIHLALLQIALVRMMDQAYGFGEQLRAFADVTFALMCKSGEMVLRTNDEASVSAFFEELHRGIADMVLAKTPLMDIGVVVLRAFQAAREAEDKRRTSTDKHLAVLELLKVSCFAWAAATNDYTLRLEAMLANSGSIPST